ncbi:hypothetical protein T10_8565 [Trichinella papuae]|uniref:Uncharacterized protein n=1 Tax=Trichinella papuae TaxID=268474 RepID=A0A0V1MNW0_9BILA|nr:hypothetical protein T10_8565 [Trichinella papuae]
MHNFPKSELKSVTLLIIELSDRCILSLDKSWVRSASTFDLSGRELDLRMLYPTTRFVAL